MKKILISLSFLFFFAIHADAKRYIVTVQNDTRAPINWDVFVTRSGGEVVKTFNFIDGALLDLSEDQAERLISRRAPGMTIEEDKREYWLEDDSILNSLYKRAGMGKNSAVKSVSVKAVSPVAAVKDGSSTVAPVPPLWEDWQFGKEYPWGISRVNAHNAWSVTEGAGVKVAVIDTGINYDHEDLKDNYAGGVDFTYEMTGPMDGHGHGTHVAGIIAAARNGKGVVGVAPKAKIYSVRVLASNGSGDRSSVIEGIEWAIKNGMQVINMSLGSPEKTEAQEKAIKAAYKAGIIIVCSAGNRGPDGVMSYPGRYPETIAVAASDKRDKVAYFSSRGKEVDVIAPGASIISTTMDGEYGNKSGTSMASPHVAGIAALALSMGYSADSVRIALKSTATPLPNLTPEEQGRGLANAAWLVKSK